MQNTTPDLQLLRNFAATARRGSFGVPLFRLDGVAGEFRRVGNQSGAKMNGEKWAAVAADVMGGYQRIEKGKAPIFVLGRIADGYAVPERETLGDLPEEGDKDPWASASWLPFWNPETREVLLFQAANDGSKGAVADIVDAYCTNVSLHPEQANFDPLVELSVDSYENKHGRTIYRPVFETLDWIERPPAILRLKPPPVRQLELAALPPPDVKAGAEVIPIEKPALPKAKKKQQQKVGGGGGGRASADMDDEIPFAAAWW
jgi:hypothetical protein